MLKIGIHDFNLDEIWREVRGYIEDEDYDYILDQLNLLRREYNHIRPSLNTSSFRYDIIRKNIVDQFTQKLIDGSDIDIFKDELDLLLRSIQHFKHQKDQPKIPYNRLEFIKINSPEKNPLNISGESSETIANIQNFYPSIYRVFSKNYNTEVEPILNENDLSWLSIRVEEYFSSSFQFPLDNHCITNVRAPKSFVRAFFFEINRIKRPNESRYPTNYIPFIKSCFTQFLEDSEDNIKKNFKRGLPELNKILSSITS